MENGDKVRFYAGKRGYLVYAEGLPECSNDYEWRALDGKINPDIMRMSDVYAQDAGGNLWVKVYIGFAYD